MSLEPIPDELPMDPYAVALKRLKAGRPIELPCAFNHPEHLRAAGTIKIMRSLGKDFRGLPDFELTVQGRSGKTIEIKMLEHHVQIYHSFADADVDVAQYRKARGLDE